MGGYDVGSRVKSSATTPAIEVPAGGTTTLRLDLQGHSVESECGCLRGTRSS